MTIIRSYARNEARRRRQRRESLEPKDAPSNLEPGNLVRACVRCQGNGEIVVDWDKYLHPANLAEEEASVAECPDCNGRGVLGEYARTITSDE